MQLKCVPNNRYIKTKFCGMKIAIIGAGAAGVSAARHSLQDNHSIDVFEQTNNVGGTWNYTDCIGLDENGISVHSSMYQGLRTNLPKEVMSFEDFPYRQQDRSYLYREEVLEYITEYVKKFQIESHIKFLTQVVKVLPQNNSWLVEFQNVKTKQKQHNYYDAVIVCNGHYKDPFIPEILGMDRFSGPMKHSHDYRSPDCYKSKKVLVLGAGPSGRDISQQIATVANKVYLSHKSNNVTSSSSDCLQEKPLVREFHERGAVFEDGTSEDVDEILFCTGYNYSFPFLADECGVKVIDNYVHPLYKQMISIENPTLAFLGLPLTICPFPLFDIQIRFFLATLNGHFKLPSKEKMLEELDRELLQKKSKLPLRKYHYLGEGQGDYFDDLADTAQIKKKPSVIHKLYMRVRMNRNLDDCFRIIDDDNWEQLH